MATSHPCVIGQRVAVPQFHFLFTPKSRSPEFSTNKRLNFCVSVDVTRSLASSLSIWNTQKPSLTCLRNCATVDAADTNSCVDQWDWNRWSRHFSEIEEIETVVSLLKLQLDDAIKIEDFNEASKLKASIAEAIVNDAVAEIMCRLQTAIREECYYDASRLCSQTGSGLVGWWVGYPQDSEEPFGRIVHITPGVGRFIGKSYSPSELVSGAAGTPLFEIFVVKDTDRGYLMQVVYFKHVKQKTSTYESSYLRAPQPSNASIESSSIPDVPGSEVKEKKEDKLLNAEEKSEEGITNLINFVKDKIPGLKLKVTDIPIPDKEIVGSNDATEELVGEGNEETNSADEKEDDSIETIASMGSADNGKHLNIKHIIRGVLHNREDPSIEDEVIRVSADITNAQRDSFVLHVPGISKKDIDCASKEQVTALAAQDISDMMPPDVVKAFWGSEKNIAKLAISQAQKGNGLSEYTTFNRITSPENDLDPYDGLYVGAFEPHGTEIVQLKRKYGRWDDDEGNESSDAEFFEYVEAVKLTGDPHVPAGQVRFRAKIENGKRSRKMYPAAKDLGVLGSYEAQGRIAEFGFKNPKWVVGRLLRLNRKGSTWKGGDLGFVYTVHEKCLMVVFSRLRLPE